VRRRNTIPYLITPFLSETTPPQQVQKKLLVNMIIGIPIMGLQNNLLYNRIDLLAWTLAIIL
jgi:hypothetical protein